MIIPMLCVTIFVILVVWFLLPSVARLMIHTPTAISIFVFLSMVQLMSFFISMPCTLCTLFLHDALPIFERVDDRGDRADHADLAAAQALRIAAAVVALVVQRSEEHTSELQSRREIVCRLLLEKKSIFVCLSMLKLMAVFISMRCTLCGQF